jgi:hypothetical protein
MTVQEDITALVEQAAEVASELAALAVALQAEDYDTADNCLEAAKGKLVEIDDALGELVHHHRRGKI